VQIAKDAIANSNDRGRLTIDDSPKRVSLAALDGGSDVQGQPVIDTARRRGGTGEFDDVTLQLATPRDWIDRPGTT
jgi:hypothetical protein